MTLMFLFGGISYYLYVFKSLVAWGKDVAGAASR